MNEDCEQFSCPVPANAIQDYLNQYSLEALIVQNQEVTVVVNGVPITIPAGTFTYSIPSGTTIFPNLTYQGCQSLISIPVPPGSSIQQLTALVQQMLNQAAQQQAVCDAASTPGIPPSPPKFLNTLLTAACVDFPAVAVIGTLVNLPVGVTYTNYIFTMAAGIFASNTSQADANQRALQFLNQYILANLNNGNLECGYANQEQIVHCDNGNVKTVPANSFFSTTSQADANQQAIDSVDCAYYNTEQIVNCSQQTGCTKTIAAGMYSSNVSQADADAQAVAAAQVLCATVPPLTPLDPSNLVWNTPSLNHSVTSVPDHTIAATAVFTSGGGTLHIEAGFLTPQQPDTTSFSYPGNDTTQALCSDVAKNGNLHVSVTKLSAVNYPNMNPDDSVGFSVTDSHGNTLVDAEVAIQDVIDAGGSFDLPFAIPSTKCQHCTIYMHGGVTAGWNWANWVALGGTAGISVDATVTIS